MLTGQRPWAGLTDFAIGVAVCTHNRRLPLPDTDWCPPALAALLTAVWQEDPLQRPSAAAVVTHLQHLLGQLRGGLEHRRWELAPALEGPAAAVRWDGTAVRMDAGAAHARMSGSPPGSSHAGNTVQRLLDEPAGRVGHSQPVGVGPGSADGQYSSTHTASSGNTSTHISRLTGQSKSLLKALWADATDGSVGSWSAGQRKSPLRPAQLLGASLDANESSGSWSVGQQGQKQAGQAALQPEVQASSHAAQHAQVHAAAPCLSASASGKRASMVASIPRMLRHAVSLPPSRLQESQSSTTAGTAAGTAADTAAGAALLQQWEQVSLPASPSGTSLQQEQQQPLEELQLRSRVEKDQELHPLYTTLSSAIAAPYGRGTTSSGLDLQLLPAGSFMSRHSTIGGNADTGLTLEATQSGSATPLADPRQPGSTPTGSNGLPVLAPALTSLSPYPKEDSSTSPVLPEREIRDVCLSSCPSMLGSAGSVPVMASSAAGAVQAAMGSVVRGSHTGRLILGSRLSQSSTQHQATVVGAMGTGPIHYSGLAAAYGSVLSSTAYFGTAVGGSGSIGGGGIAHGTYASMPGGGTFHTESTRASTPGNMLVHQSPSTGNTYLAGPSSTGTVHMGMAGRVASASTHHHPSTHDGRVARPGLSHSSSLRRLAGIHSAVPHLQRSNSGSLAVPLASGTTGGLSMQALTSIAVQTKECIRGEISSNGMHSIHTVDHQHSCHETNLPAALLHGYRSHQPEALLHTGSGSGYSGLGLAGSYGGYQDGAAAAGIGFSGATRALSPVHSLLGSTGTGTYSERPSGPDSSTEALAVLLQDQGAAAVAPTAAADREAATGVRQLQYGRMVSSTGLQLRPPVLAMHQRTRRHAHGEELN